MNPYRIQIKTRFSHSIQQHSHKTLIWTGNKGIKHYRCKETERKRCRQVIYQHLPTPYLHTVNQLHICNLCIGCRSVCKNA